VGSFAFLNFEGLTLRPVNQIITYINFDIQGANLAPSLREVTLSVGPETGGPLLEAAVTDAASDSGLQMFPASAVLGQGRSDHANFLNKNVPSVFFTDSNNGCYHTTGDEVKNTDFEKLEKQGRFPSK